jgi:hypothetical protein
MDPPYFESILLEQDQLELDIKKLSTLGESFREDLNKLKSILFEKNRSSVPNESEEAFVQFHKFLESNITSLRDRIISIDDVYSSIFRNIYTLVADLNKL